MTPALEFAGVSKQYGGLRPLRIAELRVADGERVAILGVDQPMAETFVNLATGATLPDAGEVRLFGRASSAIADSSDWLATVDRFGIVSDRAVVLEQLTVVQNLTMPFTLEIEPPPAAERAKAEAVAGDVGLPPATWTQPLAALDATGVARVRLGRAIALEPAVLLLEHASARVPRRDVAGLAADIGRLASRRGLALVALTADQAFASGLGARLLTLDGATGRLKERRRFW